MRIRQRRAHEVLSCNRVYGEPMESVGPNPPAALPWLPRRRRWGTTWTSRRKPTACRNETPLRRRLQQNKSKYFRQQKKEEKTERTDRRSRGRHARAQLQIQPQQAPRLLKQISRKKAAFSRLVRILKTNPRTYYAVVSGS